MAAVPKLIRHLSRGSLLTFFDEVQSSLSDKLRTIGPDDDHARPLLRAVDELTHEDHARLTVNADRVDEMAIEVGRAALLSVVKDRLLVQELDNDHERSLWVFLNEPESFRRAEEIRYTDEHRQGAMWTAYHGPPDLIPNRSDASLEAFRQAALKRLDSVDAYCEIYRRTRANFAGPDSELYQLTLYHDDAPTTYLEFQDQRLVRRHRRPVVEVSITYEPARGVIEVVTSGGKDRDELARLFADTILRWEVETKRIPLRRYDLSPLLQCFEFLWDPDDRIESVGVVLLRLQRISTDPRRLTLECPRRADGTVWDQAREELRDGDDLVAAGYNATQAQLSIKFLPEAGRRQGKTLVLKITGLHGCNLKSCTEQERLIGEKYLRRWGLLVEI